MQVKFIGLGFVIALVASVAANTSGSRAARAISKDSSSITRRDVALSSKRFATAVRRRNNKHEVRSAEANEDEPKEIDDEPEEVDIEAEEEEPEEVDIEAEEEEPEEVDIEPEEKNPEGTENGGEKQKRGALKRREHGDSDKGEDEGEDDKDGDDDDDDDKEKHHHETKAKPARRSTY
ncbi:hypothetical protein G6F64_008205 [Rhizopus arrhizus]|uniref:Uncharacterized protein n=1 Tax=Rhizopus oryzae TaxID=64495 RepID=A0A9P7BQH5_RHIOR|nr:hypothetical protein G6F23_006587 [Rhizopus arrhizus]KAG1305656.1 hypothetical protein G6F64_008205 [Rhizopus arrhizus]